MAEVFGLFIGFILLTGITISISALVRGWALSWLWLWFVAPIFGLQPLSIVQAIGVSIVVGFLTHQLESDSKEDDRKTKPATEQFISSTLRSVMWSLFTVLVGYIVSFWM